MLTWRHCQIFFDVVLFLLSSSVTGTSFMPVSPLVLELWQFSSIRDWPGIRKYPRLSLPNIWRLGRVRDTKFGPNVSNKMLLNAAKCQGYSFCCLLRENQQDGGGGIKLPSPPPKLGLRVFCKFLAPLLWNTVLPFSIIIFEVLLLFLLSFSLKLL